MRVAVIVVTMLAVTTPSEASQSCMSKSEARQHFGALHIYWHGADHCWDATPSRRRQIQARKKPLIQESLRKVEPKWLDSMSAMLPDDEPVLSLRTPKSQDIERHERDDVVTDTSWADRWVDIGPAQSALVARRVRTVLISPLPVTEYKSELMISPHDVVVLAFIAFVLTLGTVGVLYRNDP
ncbi:MAG: hypothetical protein ACXWKP_04315 [Bradyrhizobium sp.]